MQIRIQVSENGEWITVYEQSVPAASDDTYQLQDSFSVSSPPDFIECHFQVDGLPEFTISPVPSSMGILTGTLKVHNRLFFVTLVQQDRGFAINAGAALVE